MGALAERLQHSDEAVEAYRACLGQRFSPKALTGILRVFEKNKNTRETVAADTPARAATSRMVIALLGGDP